MDVTLKENMDNSYTHNLIVFPEPTRKDTLLCVRLNHRTMNWTNIIENLSTAIQ